jgi:general secretion pathway protein C
MKRTPLITSFILFIALCATTAYWAMQFIKPTQRSIAAPPQAIQTEPSLDAAASLFGSHATSTIASNIQLKGVVVGNNPNESVAILIANGKPAQSIRTNAEITPGVIVKEVHNTYVLLSENGVLKRVELPEAAKRK